MRIYRGCVGASGRQDQGKVCGPGTGGGCDGEIPGSGVGFTGETIKRFVVEPLGPIQRSSEELVESVGGSLECYYWMFGQYDGMAICRDARPRTPIAAATLAIISSAAFTHFETHELIEADPPPRNHRAGQTDRLSAARRRAHTEALGHRPRR